MAYPNALFSTFAFFGFILVSSCLPWNLQAWNAGACLYIIWTALACLNQFINSIAWNGNSDDKALIWCDISSKFLVGSAVAIPAASLCINRRIYKMVSTNTCPVTRREKLKALTEELAIGLGIPILEMILHYIVQGHRFDIFQDIGCVPSTYNTWVAYLFVWSWPLAIGVVSAIYSVMNLITINNNSPLIKLFLSREDHSLDSSRYRKLAGLAAIEMLGTIVISCVVITINVRLDVQPWISWEDTHYNFSRVGLIPAVLWRQSPYAAVAVEITRWLPVVCAFTFFAIFGISRQSRKCYYNAYRDMLMWYRRRFVLDSNVAVVTPRIVEEGWRVSIFSHDEPKTVGSDKHSFSSVAHH